MIDVLSVRLVVSRWRISELRVTLDKTWYSAKRIILGKFEEKGKIFSHGKQVVGER